MIVLSICWGQTNMEKFISSPIWKNSSQVYGTPYVWCMLHNFGGNIEMYGTLDLISSGPVDARIGENSTMVGVGMCMEGIEHNPVVNELMSEMAFRSEKVEVLEWLKSYSHRRYGKAIHQVEAAWEILYHHTIYNCTDGIELDKIQYSAVAVTCIVDHNTDFIVKFPDWDPSNTSSALPQAHLWYSTKKVINALRLFIDAGNNFAGSLTYRAILLTFSLSFLSLFLFSTWYQSHFLVAFTRQNPAFLRCYGFTVSSPRSQTLSPFLPSSESSSPSCCSTQAQLYWIDLIKICPLPPKSAGSDLACAPTRRQKSSGSPATRARAPTRRPAPPRALTRSHALQALSHLSCHVSPSDVTLTAPNFGVMLLVTFQNQCLGLSQIQIVLNGDSVADAVVQVDDFETRLEEWESIQCGILSWYNCTYDFALEFHIEVKLYQMRQESGQSISDYYSQTASMWEQLTAADPPLQYAEDIDLFAKYKDRRRFTQFMMSLREDFEPTRATLLNRSPLPSLDAAVKEFISEENRRPHHHLSSLDVVLATPRPPSSSSDRPRRICMYCQKPGHDITECYRKKKDDKRKQHQSRGTFPRPQAAAVSSAPVDDPVVTVSQLESMFHQYMSQPSPALSITSGTISSPDLTIPDTYIVPKLSLNLLSVGQLCELGLDLHFSNRGVDVQDPLTGKLLGTGRKIGCLFELCNLQIPSHMVSSSVAAPTTLSPDLWHSRLGHVSLSRLQLLASQGHLGSSDVSSLVLSPATGSPDSDPAPSAPSESPTDIRRSTRVRAPPSHLSDYHCYFALATLHEPHTYREASTNPLWQQAMVDELDALHKTHTWDMTTLPPGKSAVGCKWVYKIKTQADGSVERYKACLVARGFTQEYGIDYEETFAPFARLTSIRSLLAVATVCHWPLFQMDVKNAFLNGDLLEEVYMQPPPGYHDSQNLVCRLRHALYGLKQAPRAWFAKFSSVVAQQGFTPSSYDSALFIRHTSTGIHDLQKFLSQHFEMKDLGTLSYFLGLKVTSSSDGYYLSQAKYASDLLSKAGLTDSKTVSTPLELNVKLNTTDGEPLSDATLYRQLVGSLIYLTVTRPDLAYVVHLVSQFMSAPRSTHYAAVLRILRYIKGTLFHGLHFSAQSSLELRAYDDANWVGDPTDCRSTTGYCFLLGSSLISWRSKKQSVVARSSTEAEYRALADATLELLWLRWLLADIGAPQTTNTPIHCDNRSAIHIAHNDVFHERTKHIEIDCHFICHHLQQSALHLLSVSSEDQLADVFIKSHPPGRLRDLVFKLKMASSSPPCV
uniref:Reverse transcriptase Ty1/copia-type domain-containing protein n=1 Tax=Fagus sylvatica TaxID=28930 RepID=A0A2N9F074_FAGSY